MAFLGRHADGIGGGYWKRFQHFHAHSVPAGVRQMPGYIWKWLATIRATHCVYSILMAGYLCAPEGVENKFCMWIKTGEITALKQPAAAKKIEAAGKYFTALAEVIDAEGTFTVQAQADAVAKPGVKGYETRPLAEAKAADTCQVLYNKVTVMVGRFLCKKQQEESFGQAMADNLG